MVKRAMSRFSIDNLLSQSTEKLRRGTLLRCVLENFGLRKILWIEEGRRREGVSRLFVKICCLTVLKNFVGNSPVLCFLKFPLIKNFMERREYHKSLLGFFLSHSSKNFVGEPYSVSLNWGFEKFHS